ncbi:MAG: DUF4124 domain-containing protein [Thiohalophilus sp.]|jgi:hypothetical protein
MRYFILCFSLVLFSAQVVAAEKVYKKVNPDGTVEFTDKPSSDAQEIPVRKTPSINIKPAPNLNLNSRSDKKQVFTYDEVVVTAPANDETIRDNTGNISIAGMIKPDVQTGLGHQPRWMMDGKPLEKTGLALQLTNVDRGTHTVRLEVIDKQGEVVASSQTVTFHLMRYASPANPAPNYPKPKPKSNP